VNAGMMAILWTNTCKNMPAWGAKDSKVGNNPFVLAVPRKNGPVVVDVSMSQFAYGRLEVASLSGEMMPVPAGFDREVLRMGKDGDEARKLYRALPWLRDAAFAAARLCARMGATGERLEQLASKTPRLVSWKREVTLSRDRGEIMRELAVQAGKDALAGEGLRLRSRGGWVYLVPLARRSALKVVAEGPDLELAAELCDFYAGQVAKLDRTPRREGTK